MNDDLISRAAAIDILDAYQVMVENGEENPYAWARLRMSELPSAQSEVRTQMSSADCISRQSAIDRINKQREHLRPDIYEQDYIGDAAYRICAEFIERLPSAQPEQRWIPCSERLPDSKEYVLVTDYGETNMGRRFCGRWWLDCCGDKLKDVTAWMPLPEPYKEDGE